MIVVMSADEYVEYQNILASGFDGDLAFQQLVRSYPPELQVEIASEEEQPKESKIEAQPGEQISQN